MRGVRRQSITATATVLMMLASLPFARHGIADTIVGGVTWSLIDRISACPAGDSTGVSGHPSRLRINAWYLDGNVDPKIGLPPDSIYVTVANDSGTAKANDLATYTFADDSTRDTESEFGGYSRIQIPSFSGNGKVLVTLYVSGVSQGSKHVYVRTTDTNADGQTTSSDVSGCSDINYSGSVTAADNSIVSAHYYQGAHTHRQALHGTLVRRSNLHDFVVYGSYGSIGNGTISWAPNGRMVAYSAMDTCPTCPVDFRT